MDREKGMIHQHKNIMNGREEAASLQSSISVPLISGEHLKEYRTQTLGPDIVHIDLSLEHIITAGALYTVQKGLSRRDREWLRNAVLVSEALGFHIAQGFRVTTLNLWDGCDFLKEPYSSINSDLLVICLVLNPRTHAESAFCAKATMFGARGCRVSGEHKEGAWRRAVENSQPKIVVTFSEIENPMEVRGIDLVGQNYASGPSFAVEAVSYQAKSYVTKRFRMETVLRKDIAKIIESNAIKPNENMTMMSLIHEDRIEGSHFVIS